MGKYEVIGKTPLKGIINVAGSKNVALKVIIGSLLTRNKITLGNVPNLSDLKILYELISSFGVKLNQKEDTVSIEATNLQPYDIPDYASKKLRASFMMVAPLLTRFKEVVIPNPGGDKIGARPIERSVEGLRQLGVSIRSRQGRFICTTRKGLKGGKIHFEKNTHTGTETLILSAVLAQGLTVLENAAEEPEVDDLIRFLNALGANIRRVKRRVIIVKGVNILHGTNFKLMPDRNEVVTFAIAAYVTRGDIYIPNAQIEYLSAFLEKLDQANCHWIKRKNGLRFKYQNSIMPTKITTACYPGFMTDWQGPWTLLMTQADGTSTVHETIYENRFGYIGQLKKMGANISFFNPKVNNPEKFYNFNWENNSQGSFHAINIHGPTPLCSSNLVIPDLRAGATLVLAALGAKGRSTLTGIEHIDRGYEHFENRLQKLGAKIQRKEI